MYSRLYTHILNHHASVDHCAAFHHIYNNSSLFGLFATIAPSTRTAIFPHLVHQLALLLYRAVPPDELNRAKNQLKSSLAMALESRAVEVEDLGRQVSMHSPSNTDRDLISNAAFPSYSSTIAKFHYPKWQIRLIR